MNNKNFRPEVWTVRCGTNIYKAIGYEQRGIFGVPIAEIFHDECISCIVYEIINSLRTVNAVDHISAQKLNAVEISLLKAFGCAWNGCWITKAEPSGITLDEDPDPEEYNRIRDAVAEYNEKFELYERFEEAFAEYVLFDVQSDEHIFKIWKSLQEWVAVEDEDIAADNRVCLVTYLLQDWNAWFMSIVNQEFKYMNLTQTVWESWLER